MMNKGNVEKHESFGKIKFNRFSSNKSHFFGTDVSSSGGISIEVATASRERNLNSDWIFSDKSIIKVEMSYNQFYEAIGAMMNTDGVPCTLRYYDGKYIKDKPQIKTKQEEFQEEFENDVTKIGDNLDNIVAEMKRMSEGKAIKKSEFNALMNKVTGARQDIKANLPFVLKQFSRSLKKSMTEAKNGFVGFLEQKAMSLGLKEIKKQDISNLISFTEGEE